ncbi:GNAT family N-acetyltransferase [Acaricomes phytoseiuli]|uniref:bifunctional acetate--CoA ligase family protein/GNAT family N-acetyltransferase n=1 Tax=Acaricomes phytoseiuli TaxID=291968 RepID=UPI00037A13AC|nr:GNAT family N-acetyltransferase [Acaricomes phytoseiuli]
MGSESVNPGYRDEYPHQYPHHWEADVVLRDGATAHVRPICADDAEGVQHFHLGQSPDSIYMRFFTHKSQLSDRELRRFTQVDYRNRVAFVITVASKIIGIGRYDRLADLKQAEVAFNIADAHQGRGIGSILLEHLAAAARENGVTRFSAEVLPGNRKMLTVFAEAGYEVSRHFDDGLISLSFDIDPTERSREVMEGREHRAEARSLEGLLNPKSIMLIGEDGAALFQEHLLAGGYTGEIFRLDSGSGPAESADLAIVDVPYAEVEAAITACIDRGVRGALVATSGFADAAEAGLERQRELIRKARSAGMRIVGPASLGLINTRPEVSLNASLLPGLPRCGPLSVFSQSAAIGAALHAALMHREIGLSTAISAGDRADISGNDAMQFWEDDAQTGACALYLESIGNPRKFSRLARRLSRTKPVIVAKSDALGLRLPPGHAVRTTQAPAGALDAMLRQSGVIRVSSIDELSDVAQLAVTQPLPAGGRVAVVSNSQAMARVVGDAVEAHDLELLGIWAGCDVDADPGPGAALPEQQAERGQAAISLQELLRAAFQGAPRGETASMGAGSMGTVSRPDAVIVALMPGRRHSPQELARIVAETAGDQEATVVLSFSGVLDRMQTTTGILTTDAGQIPGFSSPAAAVAALVALIRYARWLSREQGVFERPDTIDISRAEELVTTWSQDFSGDELHTLSSQQSAQLLSCFGITVLESIPVQTPDQAVAAAHRLGWPVALKADDPALRHRLDLGGVRLNIGDEKALRENIPQMRESLRPLLRSGSSTLEVQAMAPLGQGCVIRALEDPLLGPVISFALTGDASDLLDDWAHRVPPLSSADVAELIRAPRAAAKLFGYHGLPAADTAALEDIAARVAVLKDVLPAVAWLELNPVLVSPRGATVLSAVIRLADPRQRIDSARRAMNSWTA